MVRVAPSRTTHSRSASPSPVVAATGNRVWTLPSERATAVPSRTRRSITSRTRCTSGEAGEDLGGGPLARLHGAVHVAPPLGGGLGAGPVDRADRLAQRVAVAGPHAGREVGPVAAARPLLLRPVELDVVARLGRTRAEEAHERVDHRPPAFRRGHAREAPGLVTFEEAEQHSG